ncbi:peptide-methionine (S)-S-oxide reductase MsrA [Salipaludibacillus agaradhaerens]|uniref:Peptide methionine sulfoxide reductase MsrA n=1 Tax=Salipaludibacillus agaradhaerens TaxID=76935 RepID=A0A9Q4B166_SALAG|nr:peptide-methionine (S)-S-oxide reductase MsrA [Salipaludibacillus agaradhaerens]MCR6096434.1 peptide-methionine (S)-S-oxide reductase MsrA [Salipaludibacillus agaradhaerens]MCR6114007.1 peptide-methionine (S)-S-oxide reductase MsrA [Salipaludibacillus agaradhaerens]
MTRGNYKKATFAGGCFWCMVSPFDEQPGIEAVVSGYTGGHTPNPTYKEVCSETTGHLEAVEITYDSQVFPYEKLLDLFWRQIDPTDPGGQFNDRGNSYTTAIFYHDDYQKELAEKSKLNLQNSAKFNGEITTVIRPAEPFYPAEEYHQYYYKKNSFHYKLYKKGSGREAFIKTYWGDTP